MQKGCVSLVLNYLCKPNSLAKNCTFNLFIFFDFLILLIKNSSEKRDGQTETWLNMKFLTPPPPSRRLLSAIRTTSEPSCYWMLFKLMTNNDLELIIGLRKSKVFWSTWCRPCGMRRTPCWSARSWTCSSPPPSSSSRSQTCNRYFCHNFYHYHVHLFLSHKICFPLEILQFCI